VTRVFIKELPQMAAKVKMESSAKNYPLQGRHLEGDGGELARYPNERE